jgi:hypothetical protein
MSVPRDPERPLPVGLWRKFRSLFAIAHTAGHFWHCRNTI